jgi:hypothetical protein
LFFKITEHVANVHAVLKQVFRRRFTGQVEYFSQTHLLPTGERDMSCQQVEQAQTSDHPIGLPSIKVSTVGQSLQSGSGSPGFSQGSGSGRV